MKKVGEFLMWVAGWFALSFLVGCGGGSSSSTLPPNTISSSATNIAPITVNSGPANNYANGAFASVTVCVPGSSTCQTIGGLLVDTGSVGLRIVSSLLTVALPQQESSGGSPVAECLQFLDSYTWGPVQTADIQISGETASSVPIQVLSDTDFKVPASSCTSSGPSADTVAALGANGILGVGLFPQDCGSPCSSTTNMYYECPSSGCVPISQPPAQQVQNPVTLFAKDNNGVIIELPAVSGPAASISGSLVFGIGTQSNNGLGAAKVFTADPSTGNFTASFSGQTYSESFIDSGSNGYFFPDSSIPQCPSNSAPGFYCPSGTENLSATNQGTNNTSGAVEFSIANADTLFSSASDSVFGDLGGSAPSYFDWGLPFFYGRNVYNAIEGTTAPGGTPPYWAY